MSTSYPDLRNAIRSERELLERLNQLPNSDIEALLKVSGEYTQVMQAEALKIKEQELTKRKQIETEASTKFEIEKTKRMEMAQKNAENMVRIKSEEQKKLEEKRTEEEKKRLEYKQKLDDEQQERRIRTKLEAKREYERLDEEQKQREREQEQLKLDLEREQAEQELERRKKLITHEMEAKAELDVKYADFNLQQMLKEHEAMREDRLEHDLKVESVKQEGALQRERLKWDMATNFFSGPEGKKRMRNIFGLIAGSIATLYAFKVGAPIATKALSNAFFKPSLVNKSVKYSALSNLLPSAASKSEARVVLDGTLKERMERVLEGTRNTSARGGLFGHIMLYGKPGTGKSMFAEQLARESKMDFALMSGPSFDQFKAKDAIVEIKNLFKWANSSKRGLLLFIDECDSFLEDRASLSPERVRVLNEFINQTGTESRKFMLIFETNRPWVLDPAVQSRITQAIEFRPPGKPELLQMLKQYTKQYIEGENGRGGWFTKQQKINSEGITEEKLEEVANKLAAEQFVGRDVTNFVIALTQAAYAHESFTISTATVDRVLEEQIAKKQQEMEYLRTREQRLRQVRKRRSMED